MGLSWVTGVIWGESEFGVNSRVAGQEFWGDIMHLLSMLHGQLAD